MSQLFELLPQAAYSTRTPFSPAYVPTCAEFGVHESGGWEGAKRCKQLCSLEAGQEVVSPRTHQSLTFGRSVRAVRKPLFIPVG